MTTAATAVRRLSRVAAATTAAATMLVGLLVTVLPAPAHAAGTCTTKTGPSQQRVERYLGLVPDGRQSLADCRVIRSFQQRHGIVPAQGYAGTVTGDLVRRLRLGAGRADLCATRAKVVCVDLTSQTARVIERGRTTWGPYAIRSGRNGYETRTGTFRVGVKDIDHVSSLYGSAMPYAMFFSGGQAFHTSDRYLYDPLGSHGCVHVLPKAAQALWDRVGTGTTVQVYGRKPGT